MANLVEWITEKAGADAIEAVVLGEMGWGDYNSAAVPNYKEQPRYVVLSWEQAKPWLDYEFHNGYGAPGCNAICVWTTNQVLFVSQYDGSTDIQSVPRNPVAHKPSMPGG